MIPPQPFAFNGSWLSSTQPKSRYPSALTENFGISPQYGHFSRLRHVVTAFDQSLQSRPASSSTSPTRASVSRCRVVKSSTGHPFLHFW